MTLTAGQRSFAAKMLRQAESLQRPVRPVRISYPATDVADAYAIQQENLAHHVGAGEVLAGRKIGLTSVEMQRLLGVDEPDYGYLLESMLFVSGAELARARFIAPRVEPEIAFRLYRPLHGPKVTEADVRSATESVAPALEIVDSRIRNWDISLVDTIADNASSAAVVLGDWVPASTLGPLSALTGSLVLNGEVVHSGTAAAVLGDPCRAVAWLANALHTFGTGLAAGDVVLPGSFTSAVFVDAGDRAAGSFPGLGEVSVTFT